MGLISTTIPNLINGVSQQPFALRLSSQSEDQVNTYPSVVEGLRKRPPTKHLARIRDAIDAQSAYVHIINRDVNEKYIVILTNGSLKVYNLDGTEVTVNMPEGNGYILNNAAPNIAQGFEMMTVADYTFIVNKNVTVAKDMTAISPSYPEEALIYVAQGAYGMGYTISVWDGNGNSTYSTFTTPDGSETWHASSISTDNIVHALMNGGTGHTGSTLNTVGWLNVSYNGSVIRIRAADNGPVGVDVFDGQGGRAMRVFKGQIQRFSELPATGAPNGFHLEVVGDASSSFDNYYVKFEETAGNAGAGVWRETLAQGSRYRLAKWSMPHVLIREANGTFTFRTQDWGEREVGDNDSAPWPSFLDRKITDIFFYRNRLGIISDENVIMSRAGDFFNFWPTTVTASLDSDPIDVSVSHTKVSLLRHAVPFNSDLMLFSDQTQFVVRSGEILTPGTISVDQATEFDAALQCKPVGVGNNLYFAVNRGEWTGIREYFQSGSVANQRDALDITSHVPKYIPGDVRKIAAASNEDALVVLSHKDRTKLWLYKYYFSDESKLQSSWSVWQFTPGTGGVYPTVVDVAFIDSVLYVLLNRPDGLYLESVNIALGETTGEFDYPVHLDRQFEITLSAYSPDPLDPRGITALELPYAPGGAPIADYALYENAYGVVAPGQSVPEGTVVHLYQASGGDPKDFYVKGNYSGVKMVIGFPFDFKYQFSTIALREEAVGGGQATIGAGRLQLRKMFLTYNRTGRFEVAVSRPGRDPYIYTYTGRTLGSPNLIIGQTNLDTGRFEFPIQGNAADTTITVQSKDHFPIALMGAEWEGFYHARAQRLT
jgi:hypothetical protein